MKKLLLSGALLLSAMCVFGQKNDDNALLKKLVDKQVLTQQEADEIVKENNKQSQPVSLSQKVDKVRDAFNTPYMKFGGYGLLMYKYSDVSNVKHDFEPRVAFLHMNGKLTNSISYFVMAELVDPLLHELYLDWTPTKQFNIRAGQFKVPFSLENQISLTNLETVMYSRTISSLVSMGDDVMKKQNNRNNGGRDIGIQASGSLAPMGNHDLIQYSLGVFQGSGITTREQNNTKDFAGTLLLQPIKGFRVGAGAYFGQATYSNDGGITTADHVRNRWGISSDYQTDRLTARAEWFKGNDGGIDREGVYGSLLYYFAPKKFNAVAKVDYYNNNKAINSEVMDYTLGLNYYFFPQCRFQLNYIHSNYSKKWGAEDSNTVYAQMQIVF